MVYVTHLILTAEIKAFSYEIQRYITALYIETTSGFRVSQVSRDD